MKRSKARVPFTSWCCNIVAGNGSRVIIMGVTYVFNIFIKISRAMSLNYFMKHTKASLLKKKNAEFIGSGLLQMVSGLLKSISTIA